MDQTALPREVDDAAGLSLAWQFVLTAAVVLALGMATIGYWVGERIAADVTRNTAVATALYVDSVIAPLTQELAGHEPLGEGAKLALRETLGQGILGKRLASFKLWLPDGTVAFSTDEGMAGKRFPLTEGLSAALAGQVHGEIDSLDEDENRAESNSGLDLLEIYSPIREPWSGRVIAVAEFYERADEIVRDIARAKLRSWLVVGAVTLAMLGALFVIVARGSQLIERQRGALRSRVDQLSHLLRQNETLRRRVQTASHRTAALTERNLRRLSADLHDGPAQLLAFALLRLDAATASIPDTADLRSVRAALDEAMKEVRNISREAALPELDRLSAADVVRRVASSHEARTGASVRTVINGRLPDLRHAEKICLYRFVQEALNNSTRHAGGVGLTILANRATDGGLSVAVSDSGPGFDPASVAKGLGLLGLEERVAGLGGSFEMTTTSGGGATLAMHLPTNAQIGAEA